jgi:hypothetical protein
LNKRPQVPETGALPTALHLEVLFLVFIQDAFEISVSRRDIHAP